MIEAIRGAGARLDGDPKQIAKAAGDFEALLVSQLLRHARSGEGGWLGSGEDTTSSPVMEMAEESLAQALSAQGGLGLAAMVQTNLNAGGSSAREALKLSAPARPSGED